MGYHGLSEIVILRPSPNTEVPMKKIYIVRLSDAERTTCLDIIKKLKGSSQKVRRAHILLQADADGPNWRYQL